ncbi:Protein ABHD8 [Taenia crassiceps]|uniref:acylglycerol lipase n=1 Tax=Taenia crassiceps TaxID=6207 RepID=A0ABR4QKM4_9CEST
MAAFCPFNKITPLKGLAETREGRKLFVNVSIPSLPDKGTIFFIYGVGESERIWNYQVKYFLLKGYRTMTIDLVGHGASPIEANCCLICCVNKKWHIFSTSKSLSICLQCLSRKELEAFCVFDEHFKDVQEAVELAESRSETVQRLVLISGGAPIPLEHECSIFGINPLCLSLLTPCIRQGFQRLAFSRRGISSRSSPEGKYYSSAGSEERKAAFQFNAYTLWATMEGQKWPEGNRYFYGRIDVPVLLICGRHDRLVSEAEEEEALSSLRYAQLRRLPKAGNMGMLEDPKQVNEFTEEHIINPSHPLGLPERNQSCTNDSVLEKPITSRPNCDTYLDNGDSLVLMNGTEYSREKYINRRVDDNAELHSKLLRVREPGVGDPVEAVLLSKWWSNYMLQIAAIICCFGVKEDSASCRVNEKAFDEELIAINEKWNSQTQLGREHYYFVHFNEKISKLVQNREEYDTEEARRMEILKAKLLSVKNGDKEMVTRENVDERVDEIMSSSTFLLSIHKEWAKSRLLDKQTWKAVKELSPAFWLLWRYVYTLPISRNIDAKVCRIMGCANYC